MKKTLGIIVCGLLSGCNPFFTGYGPNDIQFAEEPTPAPGLSYPYQDSAPLPWVSVLPSERATQMKGVDFQAISRQMRHDMKFPPFVNKFRHVKYVLLDYGIEQTPASPPDLCVIKEEGVSYSKGFIPKEEKYVMKASFYTFENRPPNPPCFEEKIYMDKDNAGPDEAIRMMAHEIILDHLASPLKKIFVNLD